MTSPESPRLALADQEARRPIKNLRWYIGGLLFLSTVINYIDRQTLNVLAPYIKSDYHWTNSDFALLIIAFRIAYSFGQTAAGRFIDRVGTRDGLSVGVTFYSIAAMLTSLANGLGSFVFFVSCSERGGRELARREKKPLRNGFQSVRAVKQ